ncbi:hypothetical protein IJ579_05085 [bacterium]|nr:hypothetical protein [bacterium]
MECPNCGAEIDKNTLVCPNCKKVLKIICHKCRTVNTKNVCKKCGEILASKCVKCGKINLTVNEKCTKCGYPTTYSAIQAESLTDNFAVMKIEFPNSDVVKARLGSNKLFAKFRSNFDNMIVKFVHSLGLRRQIYEDDIYIIRFNRMYTPKSSAEGAMKAAIELINLFARLNVKLLNRINTALKCNITIMQKSATDDPNDISSGFRANMLNQGTGVATKALDSVQVITDDDLFEFYNNNYKLEGLDSSPVNGRMKRFYEVNLKKFIHVEEFIQEDTPEENDTDEIPNFVQNGIEQQEELAKSLNNEIILDQELYNMELISFEEVNCNFYTTENIRILDQVKQILQMGGITAIKGADIYQPYTIKLLSVVNEIGIYENIIPITCHDDMKYAPYSFFRNLISTVLEYCVSQKLFALNDYSMFENTNSSGIVQDLITLTQRGMNDIYQTRDEFFKVFLDVLEAIPNTLIYIENFEKIDESSLAILDQLFDHFEDLKISYLISYDKDFSLHKHSPFLLSRPYYSEITLIPASFESIVNEDQNFYKFVMDDFYFQRVAKYDRGSILFLDFAIQYLVESGIYAIKDGSLVMVSAKTAIIPSNVERLIQRRLNLIKDKNLIRFLTMSVLLGSRVDAKTVESFGFENWQAIADNLYARGFLYIYNNCVYFSNYNLLKKNLLGILPKKDLDEIVQKLFETCFSEGVSSPVKAFLYEMSGEREKVIQEWEKLANINLSMGDFNSYINCSEKILKCLDSYASDWSKEDLERYKTSIYENIAINMPDYNPAQSRDIAELALNSLKKSPDKKRFVEFCTKMIQGSVSYGEYYAAQTLTHKILSVMEGVSINPDDKNFDFYFLLISLTHVKILFNIGEFNEAVNLGYNVLNVIDSNKINRLNLSNFDKEEFESLVLECIACIAIANTLCLKEDVNEFLSIMMKLFTFIPSEYSIFGQLQNLIRGQAVTLPQRASGKNAFVDMLFHIIKAFTLYQNEPKKFAQEIYKTKVISKYTYMTNFELLSDLLIGYSYIQLGSYKKSSVILSRVEKTAKNKGLAAIVYIASYLMSIQNIKQKKYDIAYGLLNNSGIQMEKSPICEYFVLLNKVNMYIVLMLQDLSEQAQICMEQAKYIVNKYLLNFNLNIDIQEILRENQVVRKDDIQLQTISDMTDEVDPEEFLSEEN